MAVAERQLPRALTQKGIPGLSAAGFYPFAARTLRANHGHALPCENSALAGGALSLNADSEKPRKRGQRYPSDPARVKYGHCRLLSLVAVASFQYARMRRAH